ncbi:MAG TPA: multicopper oxidase family protein [Solirubrobacterales bacterium]|nr:multicopper oxidase family protein [Solirubrobacterales bacterium]
MGRRRLTALWILALALTAGGFGAGCGGGEDEQTAEAEADAVVPFSEPQRVKLSEGPFFLVPDLEEIVAGGQEVRGRSYNGQLVGPTLVIQPGETFALSVVNQLSESTNLHFHGFHVSPKQPSDEVVHLEIKPGKSYKYEVKVPPNHDQGSFWYHSHNHHTSEGQVFGGMSGVALIGKPQLPPGVNLAADRVLALKDFQVKNGEIPLQGIDSDAATTRTVNGLLEPSIFAAPNSIELWHLANIGADIFYKLELAGNKFYVLTEDGNPSRLGSQRSLVLPPGKRFDVLVQFGSPTGYALKTLPYSTGPGGDNYPEATLARVYINGPAAKGQGSLSREAELVEEGLPQATAPSRVKKLTEDEDNEEFFINGKVFDPNRIDDEVQLGAVEDWLFVNETDEQHPIHIHQDDFWVIEESGQPVNPQGQQDTVIVPPKGSIKLRIQWADFTGEFVYHCHILNHEDHGMMAVIKVSGPQGGGSRDAASSSHPHHDHSSHSH